MIETMKYVNLIGKLEDFDDVVENYISRFEIQLEQASTELCDKDGICAFDTKNIYTPYLKNAQKLIEQLEIDLTEYFDMPKETALEIIDVAAAHLENLDKDYETTLSKIEDFKSFIADFEPFSPLDFTMENLMDIRTTGYKFGKMPYGSYKQFQTLLFANKNLLFVESRKFGDYMYGLCFFTEGFRAEAGGILDSFHFEKIFLPYELDGIKFTGYMSDVLETAKNDLAQFELELKSNYAGKLEQINIRPVELSSAYLKVKHLQFYSQTRKLASTTNKNFFIFVGWMTQKEALRMETELEFDNKIVFSMGGDENAKSTSPPTKLKNMALFKPFEFLITMYGLPGYKEVDPTVFIAFTYSLLFGIMFGDVGQGLVLSFFGFLYYKINGMKLGGIVSVVGLFSTLFGVMYGSIFGIEDIIPAIWVHPTHSINTLLISALTLGTVLIMFAMFLNVLTAVKQKNLEKLVFSPNGVAGIIFYVCALLSAYSIFTNMTSIAHVTIPVCILCLCLIAFREPIMQVVQRRKLAIHGGILLFVFECIIEMLEVLLSYFTNTLSFVRVGAFALSHAGIMQVIMMLSEATKGEFNPVVLIIGNIVVIGFEGLVVGIQALRLGFYEMFSRFYEGNGRQFVPYRENK